MTWLVNQKREAVLELLRAAGKIDEAAIARAELVAVRTNAPVEQVLNQLGALSDDDLVDAYAKVSGCQIWRPATEPPAIEISDLGVSVEFLRRQRIIPLRRENGALICAAIDPLDDEALSGLVFAVGGRISLKVARPSDFGRVFAEAFEAGAAAPVASDERRLEREIDQVADGSLQGAGARLVAQVFEAAVAAAASDIHFEPRRHDLCIRFRVDGQMIDHRVVSADLAPAAVSRIKVVANLNLGERRLPQDGRTSFVVQGRTIDVRVATAPTVFGEAAVLRILDRASVPLDLDALGLSPAVAATLRRAVGVPHGLFLVTGPTGSGKTTTLYAMLQTFAGSRHKILSVEDPVEYHFEHVSQTQVAPAIGLTFAAALRSFLRLDPDVILVGEIRDPETAAVAIQAAMTGHFVLASVHANDALAVLPRLQDMGIEPYQIAAGFRGAAAQRLVRRLCQTCAQPGDPEEAELAFVTELGLPPVHKTYHAVGCPRCGGTGYRGRTAIGEAFLSTEGLLRAVADRASAADLTQAALTAGLSPMAVDGCRRAEAGETSLAEVMAAVHV